MGATAALQGRADDPEPQSADATAERDALERKFCESLTGVTLVGSFTVTGEGDGTLKEDRYQIDKVTKGKGNFFVFEARIQYEGKDQVFKMPLEVRWAGDTPVITLTNILVPGLGTFTARVLFYEDHYAGTWNGKDHGGHLFGRIEHAKTSASKSPDGASPGAQP
ncbi:MAG: hypothetical protein K1X74_14430 [Pirellulales bacterium]|nr:hypothetical protein [Pirellulales bacterium]